MQATTETRQPGTSVGQLLRDWRTARGMSQLDLRDTDTIQYVTNLLVDFIDIENVYRVRDNTGQGLEYVFDILEQAGQAVSPSARREHYQHLGDMTLYNLGLFPEALTYGRRTVSPDYYAEAGRRSFNHAAQIAEPKNGAALFLNHASSESCGVQQLAFGLDDDPLVGVVHHASATNAGRGARGLQNVLHPDAIGPKPIGIHLDLELADITPEYRYLRHTRRGQESRSQSPVHEGSLLHS